MMNRIERLRSFLEKNPKDEFSLYALALEYKKLEKFNESISYLKECLKLNNSNLAAYYQLCEIYSTLKQVDLLGTYLLEAQLLAKQQNDIKTLNELISLQDEHF